jgi:hypothetical protein
MKRVASFLVVLAACLQITSAEIVAISTDQSAPMEQALSTGIARFGSHTQAQISDSGSVTLTRGLALFSSQSGLFRHRGIQVSTPQGGITVRGTALIAILADGSIKITCLEGQVKQDLNGKKQTLEVGMISMSTQSGQSSVAQVELLPLIQSSALLGANLPKLPRADSLARIAKNQAKALDKTIPKNATLIANGQTPDQSNTVGASNIVALNNVIEASPGLSASNASTSSFSFGSASTSGSAGSISTGVTLSGVSLGDSFKLINYSDELFITLPTGSLSIPNVTATPVTP